MEGEQWAACDEFPAYAVSNMGRVMNLKTNSILRPRDNSYGYARVALRKDGRTHDVYIHHLVAAAFILGYRKGVTIKHKEDNGDNSVRNLRFQEGVRIGALNRTPRKPKARRIRIVETNEVFLTVESCAKYIDGDVSSIYRVLRGDRLSHKGFTFEYKYEEQR